MSTKGNLKKKRKSVVLARDGYRCQYCGLTRADGAILEVDHKVPRARGGSDRMSNLITSCRDCNRSKRDKPLEIPPIKKPERFILNADGSITNILPKGVTPESVAKSDCGIPKPCQHCGDAALHRVVWRSPLLVGRENKSRTFIYAICDECSERLFVKREDAVGEAIDKKLFAMAEAATHVRLVESFDISGGAST